MRTRLPSRTALWLVPATLVFVLVACGPEAGAGAGGQSVGDADPASACLEGAADCDDMGPGDGDGMVPSDIAIVDEFRGEIVPFEITPNEVGEAFPLHLSEAVVDGDSVTVAFSAGRPECVGVADVETQEGDDEVVVTVRYGELLEPAGDCDGSELVAGSLTFELSAALDGRALLDGSRAVPDAAQS